MVEAAAAGTGTGAWGDCGRDTGGLAVDMSMVSMEPVVNTSPAGISPTWPGSMRLDSASADVSISTCTRCTAAARLLVSLFNAARHPEQVEACAAGAEERAFRCKEPPAALHTRCL